MRPGCWRRVLDWAQAAATAAQVDRVLFFSLEGAVKLADALGYRGEVIDMPDRHVGC